MAFDEKIFQYLKNSDPDERKKAVKALAQTQDKAAIPILAKVYSKDPDAEVRELALRAGRFIKKQMHAAKWQTNQDDVEYVPVSDDDQREARRCLNRALKSKFSGDFDAAQDMVFDAFTLNPNLQYDREARRVAADVFNLSEQEAVDLITKDATDEEE